MFVRGLFPAWRIAGPPVRGISSGPGMERLGGILVAAQYALAIVLLTGAGLLVRSFQLLIAVQSGFDATHLLTISVPLRPERSVPLPPERYPGNEPARGDGFFDDWPKSAIVEAIGNRASSHRFNKC